MLTRSLRQFQFAAVAIVLLTVATRLPTLLHRQAIDDKRQAYIADCSDPEAQYPVRDFPILARLLAEHYEQVAHTAQGMIYRRR